MEREQCIGRTKNEAGRKKVMPADGNSAAAKKDFGTSEGSLKFPSFRTNIPMCRQVVRQLKSAGIWLGIPPFGAFGSGSREPHTWRFRPSGFDPYAGRRRTIYCCYSGTSLARFATPNHQHTVSKLDHLFRA